MNKVSKKENGVVFTPDWVADFMVEQIFKNCRFTGDEKILDAGCGEGVFTIKLARIFSEITGKSIDEVIKNNIYFIDLNKQYIETTENKLKGLLIDKSIEPNAIADDFCFHDFRFKFDFVIGNPPYVRIQNLNDRRELLQKKFFSAINGSIDLYFCFFEKALNCLSEYGRICFISPNSHFYSAAGKNLRKLLLPFVYKIVNFDHFQVFKDATVYSAITFLTKQENGNLLYADNHKNDFFDLDYKKIIKNNLNDNKWEFFDQDYFDFRCGLLKKYARLNDVADIHYGLATLKDDLYVFSPSKTDKEYYYWENYKIEKKLVVPIIKASTYKGTDQGLFIIYPYRDGKIIIKNEMKSIYPFAYKYFCDKKGILASRDKGGGAFYEEFYAFGRTQGLKTSFGKKIITSTMNLSPRFFVVDNEKATFYSGYCIKPKHGIDIYELCESLNSDLMKKYIDSVSKSYRGGYKSYAKSFLKDFVHPKFLKIQDTLF